MRKLIEIVLVAMVVGCGAEPIAPPDTPVVPSTPAAPSAVASPPAATAAQSPEVSPEPVAPAETKAKTPAAKESELPSVTLVTAKPARPPSRLPAIAIVAPAKNQVIPAAKADSFVLRLRASGFQIDGGYLCVRIDKHPCLHVTDLKKPLTLKEIDPTLDEGQHVVTVFARRGSGESIKPVGKKAAFASHTFYVGKKVLPVWKDGGPMLFVDPPADGPAPPDGVLIDFYVANAELARGKYVVHASVGGPGLGMGEAVILDSLAPLRLVSPRPGEYTVRMTLYGYRADLEGSDSTTTVSYTSAPLPGAFSEVTRTFRVTAPAQP